MNEQQIFIATLISKATATRNMITEARTVLAETEKQIAEECADLVHREGMSAFHVLPGAESVDWAAVSEAGKRMRAAAKKVA